VILLRYNPGSESSEKREQGFLETLNKEFPSIKVLSSDQYSGTTPETSLDKCQQLFLKFGDQVTGAFAVCEPNATGMLGALEDAGMAKRVKFVGFDPSPRMVQALREKKMHGIVLQDPVRMGYLAVKTMHDHLEGHVVEKRVPTGETMATPENMDDEQIAKLLKPAQFTDEDEPKPENKKYTFAVIPKGTTHEFWKSVHAGAAQAARELGDVEIVWKGPYLENDRAGQIDVVQNFVTSKVDGIILAPLDSRALVASVKEAKDAGIPSVIFDSALEDESIIVSYVATDNYHGGVLAARRLGELLGAAEKQAAQKPVAEKP
jgi:ABC-type sugar transport system substrate-binding protein